MPTNDLSLPIVMKQSTTWTEGSAHSGQVKQMERKEDQGKHVHQDQENIQHESGVFLMSSLGLPH